jgi:hypothetical protein
VDDAVRRLQLAEPGASVGTHQREAKRNTQAVYYGSTGSVGSRGATGSQT